MNQAGRTLFNDESALFLQMACSLECRLLRAWCTTVGWRDLSGVAQEIAVAKKDSGLNAHGQAKVSNHAAASVGVVEMSSHPKAMGSAVDSEMASSQVILEEMKSCTLIDESE